MCVVRLFGGGWASFVNEEGELLGTTATGQNVVYFASTLHLLQCLVSMSKPPRENVVYDSVSQIWDQLLKFSMRVNNLIFVFIQFHIEASVFYQNSFQRLAKILFRVICAGYDNCLYMTTGYVYILSQISYLIF